MCSVFRNGSNWFPSLGLWQSLCTDKQALVTCRHHGQQTQIHTKGGRCSRRLRGERFASNVGRKMELRRRERTVAWRNTACRPCEVRRQIRDRTLIRKIFCGFPPISSLLRSSVTRCTLDIAKHHQTIIAKGAHDERWYTFKVVRLASPCAPLL